VQAAKPVEAGDYLELEKWAAQTPHAVALAAPGSEPLTYAGLWSHVTATSEAFLRAGIRPGGVAALALPNGPAFVTATLAITLQSACAPLDLGLTRDEYRSYLPRIGASTIIFEQGQRPSVVEMARELGMRLIGIRSSPDAPAGVFCIDAIQDPAEERPGRRTDAAFLLLTSATTDTPKLVPWSRSNVRAAVSQDSRALEMTAADRFLSLMPLCHASGLYTLLTHLFAGGSVYCPPSFDISGFLEALQVFRPTSFSAGPAVHRIVLAQSWEDPDFFRRIPLRFVRSAGAPPQPGLIAKLEELLGAPVLDSYGLTEMVGATRSTSTLRKPGSVGKSIDGEMVVMDDAGRVLPPETEGEVAVRGPMLMSGYLDDPEANQAAFTEDGWFRTGDIGWLDHEGYLFLVGRRKEIINRGGRKIVPLEVDNVLATHPEVTDVAAFVIPHPTLGEDVAAAAVLRDGATVSEMELRRFAAERLAAYKIPRRIFFVESIPRTTVGKPKRTALAEQFRDLGAPGRVPRPSSPEAQRPPTAVETRLIDIWRRILGVEQIGLEDSFFDLGGDSLSAAILLAEAEKLLDPARRPLDGSDFFDQPTVASLARILAKSAARPELERSLPNRVVLPQNSGFRIPFFCFSSTERDPYQFRHLSQELNPHRPMVVVCPSPAVQNSRRLKIDEVARQSVASIRALRKHGPYILGGYCYGGVVAFETARQLADEGEEIALLGLFDTPTPGYPKPLRGWRRYTGALSRLLRGIIQGDKAALATIAAQLRDLGQIAAEKVGLPPRRTEAASDPEPEALSMLEYVPRILSAPMVHFIAADSSVSEDRKLAWRDFAGGGFETRPIAGDHNSLFGEAYAPALAAELESVLQAASSAFDQSAPQACSSVAS
jgi:oxalate---CoA ligase